VLNVVLKKMVKFRTEDLLEEPDERDHDDGGEDAEGEGLEEGAQVQHHRQQHQGRHQARQQRPDNNLFGFFLFMYDIQHCFICRP
jgi:hypothetical protein